MGYLHYIGSISPIGSEYHPSKPNVTIYFLNNLSKKYTPVWNSGNSWLMMYSHYLKISQYLKIICSQREPVLKNDIPFLR